MRRPSAYSTFLAIAAAMLAQELLCAEVLVLDSCGPPPPPKPAARAVAEPIPPGGGDTLAPPVTPMRRMEKKKPPEAPVIITKIEWGTERDWNTDRNDVNNLLI